MEKRTLKNKPLVEAIFELRWDIKRPSDPNYKIIIGRFYEEMIKEYPHYEALPTADFPEEMMRHMVQYRYRKEENKWPLVQLGPGVISLNDTDSYSWTDFQARILKFLKIFFDIYPNIDELKIVGLQLRYIDALEFNYENNIFDFLKKYMKLNLNINDDLFEETKVNKLPIGFDFKSAFLISKPKGALKLKYARGKNKGKDALIWETIVESINEDIPKREKIKDWIKEAHHLTYNWFFKTIEGELEERFK